MFLSIFDVLLLALALATPFAANLAVRRRMINHHNNKAVVPSLAGSPLLLAASALAGVALHRVVVLLSPLARSSPAAGVADTRRLLLSAASFVALCASVPLAATAAAASEGSGRQQRLLPHLALLAASAAVALGCFHSVDAGSAALLLPLCCWAAFSVSLSVFSSRFTSSEKRSRKSRSGGGNEGEQEQEVDDGDGDDSASDVVAARARRLAGVEEVSLRKEGEGEGEKRFGAETMNGDVASVPAPTVVAAPALLPTTTTEATPSPSPSLLPPPPPPASAAAHSSPRSLLAPRPPPTSDSLLPKSFSDPRAAGFKVRGPNYFADRQKISPPDSRARLSVMDLVSVPAGGIQHISRFIPSIKDSRAPFTFVWQVMVPGGGGGGSGSETSTGPRDIAMVCAWELSYDPLQRVRDHVEKKRAQRERERRKKKKKRKKQGGFSPSFLASFGRSKSPTKKKNSNNNNRNRTSSLEVELSGVSAETGGLVVAAPSVASPVAPSSADRAMERRRSADGDGNDKNNENDTSNLFLLPFTVGGHRRASTAAGVGDAEAAGDPFGSAEHRSGSGAVPEVAPVALRRIATTKKTARSPKKVNSVDDESDDDSDEGEEADEEDDEEENSEDDFEGCDPFDLSLARFIESTTDAERHARFKIIPRIDVGAWVVKRAVGQNTPVLLGNKVATSYHKGPRHVEVDVDVGSSRTAAHVVGLVQGALKSLEISIAVLMEGKERDELPESLLGTVKLNKIDLSLAPAFEGV